MKRSATLSSRIPAWPWLALHLPPLEMDPGAGGVGLWRNVASALLPADGGNKCGGRVRWRYNRSIDIDSGRSWIRHARVKIEGYASEGVSEAIVVAVSAAPRGLVQRRMCGSV